MLVVLLLLGGCARAPGGWSADDVRLLDPAGDAPSPGTDIIALYARSWSNQWEIRVDFLDLAGEPPDRVYLAFDTVPGGSHEIPGTNIATDLAWDVLVSVPTPDTARFYFPDGSLPPPGLAPAAAYNLHQDYLTVGLPADLLPGQFKVQAFALSPDGLADTTEPVASDAPPPARAPMLLSFRDVLPAALPATALRSWDGAHTGPYGERHGLHPLLIAARKNHIPLALLDLRTPESLSALDIIGGLQDVRQMQDEGLLMIPETDFAYPQGITLPLSVQAGERSGLQRSDLAYSLIPEPLPGYSFQFTPLLSVQDHLSRDAAQARTYIPMPPETEQVNPDGPTLETRRALLGVARSQDPGDLVSLGGSLPASAWGDSDVAEAAMEYINQHPWIRVLSESKLRDLPTVPITYQPEIPAPASYPRFTSAGQSAGLDSVELVNTLRGALQERASSELTGAAWDMLFRLATPSGDQKRDQLQAQYLGEVGVFLAADAWARSPAPQASCQLDLDFDTDQECILANESLFSVFEKDGGRLAWLFSVKDGQPHQLVGGTEQFSVGLSDRSQWQVGQGPAGDPHQIPGSFVDADSPWAPYNVSSLGPDSLVLTSADGSREKSFRLFADRLTAQFRLAAPLQERFALTLDPWRRFNRGWGSSYYSRLQPAQANWSMRGGPSITLGATGRLAFNAYNDTIDFLYGPEDPNQDFPPGHFLPFPMAEADVEVHDGQVVTLSDLP